MIRQELAVFPLVIQIGLVYQLLLITNRFDRQFQMILRDWQRIFYLFFCKCREIRP